MVIYNFKDNLWYDGQLSRTAWEDANIFAKPYAFNSAGQLFLHETTDNADGAPLDSFIETGYFKVNNGNSLAFIDRFIIDGDFRGNLSLHLNYKKFPNSAQEFSKEYTFSASTTQVHVRARGRYIKFKIRSNSVNGFYRLGEILTSLQESGER